VEEPLKTTFQVSICSSSRTCWISASLLVAAVLCISLLCFRECEIFGPGAVSAGHVSVEVEFRLDFASVLVSCFAFFVNLGVCCSL
jgi:hypothetical protein